MASVMPNRIDASSGPFGIQPAGSDALEPGGAETLQRDAVDDPASPSAEWYLTKALSETACVALPCRQALEVSEAVMPDGGLAEAMMNHFLSGASDAVSIDLNREFDRNPQLKEYVASHIEAEMGEDAAANRNPETLSGAVWVGQGDYGSSEAGRDQQFALGGTYVEYQAVGSSEDGGLQLQVNVADNYFWSPSDATRATQCLHVCAADLVADGRAYEFDQVGEGSLSVADPRSELTESMTPLDVPSQAVR